MCSWRSACVTVLGATPARAASPLALKPRRVLCSLIFAPVLFIVSMPIILAQVFDFINGGV